MRGAKNREIALAIGVWLETPQLFSTREHPLLRGATEGPPEVASPAKYPEAVPGAGGGALPRQGSRTVDRQGPRLRLLGTEDCGFGGCRGSESWGLFLSLSFYTLSGLRVWELGQVLLVTRGGGQDMMGLSLPSGVGLARWCGATGWTSLAERVLLTFSIFLVGLFFWSFRGCAGKLWDAE